MTKRKTNYFNYIYKIFKSKRKKTYKKTTHSEKLKFSSFHITHF